MLFSVSSVGFASLGSDLSAFYPQEAYGKRWLSSLGSQTFTFLGIMPPVFYTCGLGCAFELHFGNTKSFEALFLAVLSSLLSSHEL